jgi:PAS domain S-box-containing protein
MAMRLLVVDDDEMNRDVLSRRLLRAGYEVVTAADGPETLRVVESRQLDLVLLDIMMPGMSGMQVLQQIREKFSASQLPVIMVSAVTQSAEVASALRMGANDYITKPLDWAVAQARIETRLALSSHDREMRQTAELYRLASSASGEGLWDWDVASGDVQCSPRLMSILGDEEGAIACSAEDWFERIHPGDRLRVRQQLDRHIAGSSANLESEFRISRKNGGYLWVEWRGGASRNASGVAVRVAGHIADITARKAVDPATLLPNRVWLESELEGLADRDGNTALVVFELDGFERYRETVPSGHSRRMLQAIATRLKDCLLELELGSRADLACSGEHQFVVLLRQAGSAGEPQRIALALKAGINHCLRQESEGALISPVVGIAAVQAGETLQSLYRDAQAALRHARAQGAGGSAVFDVAMRQRDLNEMRTEADLRRAIDQMQFVVHYQPKVDLESGGIAGFEALVRWNRPGFGLVMPNDFIPAAERTGMIVPIGIAVLRRACQDTAELRRRFPAAEVSVNVSGRQFSDPNLVNQVRDVLAATGLQPEALRLEVTETVVVEDAASALQTMREFRNMGVGLKLDDFGSGYASLAYLQQFPFDTLKIDRSFVVQMDESTAGEAIVRAIIEMARSLHLHVVAEGIETHAQARQLRRMRCGYGQGYLFSRPVDLANLCGLLAGWTMPELWPVESVV